MRYGQIREYDVANGPGVRTSFFVTGCTHKCPDCFNEEYQDFNAGSIWTDEETKKIIDYLNEDVVEGLTILGGEPFQNSPDLIKILREIKSKTNKNIWIYSGYTYEQILQDKIKAELLYLCDILVDGLFINDLKDLKLKFKGSSNQRIIDLNKSTVDNIVLWDK
ncbi:anaerobic ribonucleoside-triphosphate reductase activating protein [Anaerosphaera aminiphila DSM 21120]|uniref:Anaerobic ribonucleoside-triphosphate reductase-activating protein n=1 Tax=Anaerosphaera aminiphila DSM 21120 TaxID=1120995 RepID=A0A1M5RN73_9FIRM|nr:anaerobic ribonucleoside-triphosphate reductase activating protein [Anaerosphaera aminiphila]SHH27609.1 anaerobic ribonucleoside-triphosphate reductase activating protein [Anaerosphaera aminiphila DSM 21120]